MRLDEFISKTESEVTEERLKAFLMEKAQKEFCASELKRFICEGFAALEKDDFRVERIIMTPAEYATFRKYIEGVENHEFYTEFGVKVVGSFWGAKVCISRDVNEIQFLPEIRTSLLQRIAAAFESLYAAGVEVSKLTISDKTYHSLREIDDTCFKPLFKKEGKGEGYLFDIWGAAVYLDNSIKEDFEIG